MEERRFITITSPANVMRVNPPSTVQGATLLSAPPCPSPYGVFAYAHPEDCGAFFLCTNGTLTYEYCENGLLFDGHGAVHNHCNYNWAVKCGDRKVDCEYRTALHSTTLEINCYLPRYFHNFRIVQKSRD